MLFQESQTIPDERHYFILQIDRFSFISFAKNKYNAKAAIFCILTVFYFFSQD